MNNCLECEKDTKNPKFCSLSCGTKFQRKNEPRLCKLAWCYCGKSFNAKGEAKYCSRSCAARINNSISIKRGKFKGGTRIPNHCEFCNLELSRTAKKYCNNTCRANFIFKTKIESWYRGEWDATSKQGLAGTVRLYLLKQANFKCELCGWNKINPVTGKPPLEIDHIDGDCYNNIPENLQVVCPNCHSLTPTYRALNKNGKRKYRNGRKADSLVL